MSSRRRSTLLQINATLKSWISSATTEAPSTEILDALDSLKLLPVPSTEVLMETQLGITLRKIKKSSSSTTSSSSSLLAAAASKASEILTSWKKEFLATKENTDDEVSADNNSNKSKATRKSQREVKPIQSYSQEVTEKEIQINKTKATGIVVHPERKPIPTRNSNNELVFSDFPTFRPNLTPKEVLQAGSFGGTYFRPIKSGVTGLQYQDVWKEFPADWFEGLSISKQVTNAVYNTAVNKYKASCGGDLHMWESSGWITGNLIDISSNPISCKYVTSLFVEVDPYGWFQWYCRFYLGRRCSDDDRQISRGLGVIGPTGRWRRNLINKCIAAAQDKGKGGLETVLHDAKVAPKVRQLLQHWGYVLTLPDLKSKK